MHPKCCWRCWRLKPLKLVFSITFFCSFILFWLRVWPAQTMQKSDSSRQDSVVVKFVYSSIATATFFFELWFILWSTSEGVLTIQGHFNFPPIFDTQIQDRKRVMKQQLNHSWNAYSEYPYWLYIDLYGIFNLENTPNRFNIWWIFGHNHHKHHNELEAWSSTVLGTCANGPCLWNSEEVTA